MMINYKEGIKSPRRRSNMETASHNTMLKIMDRLL